MLYHLIFQMDTEFNGEDFILDDLKGDGYRHVILASRNQLHQLKQSRPWHMDGTFKLIRRPFYQFMPIHAFVRSREHTKQVPFVYVLMSRRSKEVHVQVNESSFFLLQSVQDF